MSNKDYTPELKAEVYAEQIRLLYAGASVYRPCLHILGAIIFLLIIHKHVNHFHAYSWVILLLGINVYRIYDIYKTRKVLYEINDHHILQKRYGVQTGILGVIYGFGTAFFFNQLPLLNQIYLLTLISTLAPAGLVSFASDNFTFKMYLYPLVLPNIIILFSKGQIEYFNLGVCAIMYFLVIRMLFIWNYDVITNAIKLKLENKHLLTSLQGVNKRLTELSLIDDLTQIANRRSLDENLENEWLRAKRASTPISMLMIDIDHFKQYNDEFGHVKGDECLTYVADFLKNNLNRSGDFVARYGGEEFCIIMPDTNINGAIKFAENIHSGIRELKISNPGSAVSKFLTVSVGIAAGIPGKDEPYLNLIYTSDKALYMAKNNGRNIIRTIEKLEVSPKPQLVV